MMYCSTEETNASDIYRLATILSLKKKNSNSINIKPHFFFLISLAANGATVFFSHSSFLSVLKSKAGLRSKGVVFWEVVEA